MNIFLKFLEQQQAPQQSQPPQNQHLSNGKI